MANKLKALIVDDEEFARENLSMLIEDFCTDVMVVGKASSAKEARELADETDGWSIEILGEMRRARLQAKPLRA